MTILDQIRRKRQRTTGPAVPVVSQPVPQVEIVDVEAEPETAGLPMGPPATEPAGEEVPSPPRTQVGTKDGQGKGKFPLSLGDLPLVIYQEILDGEGDEEHQRYVQHYKARFLE